MYTLNTNILNLYLKYKFKYNGMTSCFETNNQHKNEVYNNEKYFLITLYQKIF